MREQLERVTRGVYRLSFLAGDYPGLDWLPRKWEPTSLGIATRRRIFVMSWSGFWRWYDRGARVDLFDRIFSFFFDWRTWIAGFIGSGGGTMTFIWAAVDGWSPLVVWVFAIVVTAALATLVYFSIGIAERLRTAQPRTLKSEIISPESDIDARQAYFTILDRSEWREQQLRTTTDTTHLVRNWLDVRLDDEIHRALVNSRLNSWGEEVLSSGAMAPERPIPADAWVKIEIVFDRSAAPLTAAHWRVRGISQTGPIAWTGIKFSRSQIFQLFPLSDAPPELSLFDATRQAYGQTRGTAISEAAEQNSYNPLKWYASYFIAVSKTPLYGNLPFSPKRELIDPSGFDPVMNANQIVLKERNGRRFWENITIKRADFDIAIERLVSWGGEA